MKFNLFGLFESQYIPSGELPDLFPFPCTSEIFIGNDIISTYQKILSDVIERTHGLPEKYEHALYDNCLQSEASKGLLSLLAKCMFDQSELFLVYKADVLREATPEEKKTITADYKKQAKSETGIYVSFKNFKRSEVLKIYSALEFYSTSALYKSVNISKTVQIKIADLRASTALTDSSVAKAQMQGIADALKAGKSIGIDAKDTIETATVDTSAVEKAIDFINTKRAFILGLPVAYVSGELTAGIGSTGEADMRQIERGLKQYFETIIKPVLIALFGLTPNSITFKSQDFRALSQALEALRTFDMVSDTYLPEEMKIQMVSSLFDFDIDELKEAIEAEKTQREADAAKVKAIAPPTNSQGTPTATTQDAQGAGGVSTKVS